MYHCTIPPPQDAIDWLCILPSISSCNQPTATSPRPPDHCSKTELKTELTETEPLLTATQGWISEWRLAIAWLT